MSLQRLQIQGLRGFETDQGIDLAVPDGKSGSGLTVLVGPNNGGKSTVVEALRSLRVGSQHDLRSPQSFTEGRRNKKSNDRVDIGTIDENGTHTGLRTVMSGTSESEWHPEKPELDMFVLPSRRYFNPYFNKHNTTRDEYSAQHGMPQTRGGSLDNFGFRLFSIQSNKSEFDKFLGRVVQPVPEWTIDQSDQGQYYLKVRKSGVSHSSEGMGEGLVSLLLIIDAIYDSKPGSTIVIDEPELSLHPSFQRKLASLLVEISKDRQIVVATHSPYFVDFPSLFNGAKIARVHSGEQGTVVSSVSVSTASHLSGFIKNSFNPHILGLNAREAFFLEDGVILVEGQEDVIFYEKIAEELGIEIKGDFFGWGVGGAGNMSKIAALFRDLGFAKVVGILDGDKKNEILELKSAFPSYKFYSIPADDIRTKPRREEASEKLGILDKDQKIRSEYRDDMKQLLNNVNDAV